jgi:hypothetical protein
MTRADATTIINALEAASVSFVLNVNSGGNHTVHVDVPTLTVAQLQQLASILPTTVTIRLDAGRGLGFD